MSHVWEDVPGRALVQVCVECYLEKIATIVPPRPEEVTERPSVRYRFINHAGAETYDTWSCHAPREHWKAALNAARHHLGTRSASWLGRPVTCVNDLYLAGIEHGTLVWECRRAAGVLSGYAKNPWERSPSRRQLLRLAEMELAAKLAKTSGADDD